MAILVKVKICRFLHYHYPLAELSQCILDSSNGSIINVI